MSYCPFFKNGYFGVCAASGSNHVPSIAEMEEYCFREHTVCPIFENYTTKKYCGSTRGMNRTKTPGPGAISPENEL